MSFIPNPCSQDANGDCCSITFTGFCLEDGTPIGIVVLDEEQTGWFNLTTGIFTPGSPPAGTKICPQTTEVQVDLTPLDCSTDSITVCPPASGVFDVSVVDPIQIDSTPLDCETDSVTVCPPTSGIFDVNVVDSIQVDFTPLDCETDSVTVCPPTSGIFDVNVVDIVQIDFAPLDCSTDSITVCPPASGVFAVSGTVDIDNLDCSTDSITVCPPASGVFDVNIVDGSNLDCTTDSVTACPEAEATEANLSSAIIPAGIAITTPPGNWAVNDAPLVGVAASASKAAVVGASHVATAVSFSIVANSATTPTATNLTVTLRDGASGAGTILMVWRIHVAADMFSENIQQVSLGGLNVIGSTNTAMTLEFDAGVINTLEDVNLTGYTVA